MRHIAALSELRPCETRAVVINCSTKWVTSLALLSALRHARCPVVVIDCESTDRSREHFDELARSQRLAFDWLEWPLKPHPIALDRVFDEIRSDKTLLVDSDLEILSSGVVERLHQTLDGEPTAYGAGFRHGPCWMGRNDGLHEHAGYYVERMWIPLVLLRTEAIRAARRQGLSFADRREFVELSAYPRLARLLGKRYSVRGLGRLRLPKLDAFDDERALVDGPSTGVRPSFLDYDTGAALHRSLGRRGIPFATLPDELWRDVRHLHGVTRSQTSTFAIRVLKRLGLAMTGAAASRDSMFEDVRKRLEEVYGCRTEAMRSL